MSGPAYCVASSTVATTGDTARCWLLFTEPGELRQVRASLVGGIGGWKPVVYYVTDRENDTPTYVPMVLENGVAYSTESVLVGGTFTTIFPDPSAATDVQLQAIPTEEFNNNKGQFWDFTWTPGRGPKTRGGDNALARHEVCVVLAGAGSTASTCRMAVNCLWAPEGA